MSAAPDLNDYYYFVQSVDHGAFAKKKVKLISVQFYLMLKWEF